MALCDSNYCFIWIDIRGFDIPDPRFITNNEDIRVPYVIVADEAFGMSENLMRPYAGKMLSYEKKIFNYRLTLARRYVEYTFGIMCNKWRILHQALDIKIDFAENIVKAICVLHNYVRIRDGFKY
ncbi:PREDICTED: uncharacterized protein LOC107170550 [Diuraphis noxia]|uniref:uncharacterized protein LOC107170550 n=1 Tax=Diuraphis noxia TaxID=143948 RepID=UPI00076361D7|nr:PREDICTED: uncharacterized protein LOC107170550 [Diuraphis noxia]